MRICFTSDFHGSESLYSQLDSLLDAERPDLLILGGDMFPEGSREDPCGTQGRYVQEVFTARLEQWRAQVPAMQIAMIFGNHDWLSTMHALHTYHEQGLVALLDRYETWHFGGVDFLGYSKTPPTPFWLKDLERLDLPTDALPAEGGAIWDLACLRVRDVTAAEHFRSRATIERELASTEAPAGRWIFVCHAPPHDSALDRLPHVPHPVGSRAVRQFVTRTAPVLGLHGHIHESPVVTGSFSERIGSTLCVNPGQSTDRLQAVLVDMDSPNPTVRHTVFS